MVYTVVRVSIRVRVRVRLRLRVRARIRVRVQPLQPRTVLALVARASRRGRCAARQLRHRHLQQALCAAELHVVRVRLRASLRQPHLRVGVRVGVRLGLQLGLGLGLGLGFGIGLAQAAAPRGLAAPSAAELRSGGAPG